MKKVSLCLVAVALSISVMTSCEKEKTSLGTSFTAVAEDCGDKLNVDANLYLHWDLSGETIKVSDGNEVADFEAVSADIRSDGSYAVFRNEDVTFSGTTFQAYYPASIYESDGTVTLPSVQKYTATTDNTGKAIFAFTPMYAQSQSHSLTFQNLCGEFRLQLQKSGVHVKAIKITTDKKINGTFTIRTTDDSYCVEAGETYQDGENTVTLNCGNVDITTKTDFIISLPCGEYGKFDITVIDNSYQGCTFPMPPSTTVAIERNHAKTFFRSNNALKFDTPYAPEGASTSLFSVSSSKKVYFSTGNLQYCAATGVWRFANPTEVVGSNNIYASATYSGWIDLFAYATSGADTRFPPYYCVFWNDRDVYWHTEPLIGTNINDDWGHYNAISNGGDEAGMWRTPTSDEWDYLMNTRSGYSYVHAKIDNTTLGLIVFPDGITSWNFNTTKDQDKWLNSCKNTYACSSAELTAFLNAGCIFLPYAGQRKITADKGGANPIAYESGFYYYTSDVRYMKIKDNTVKNDGENEAKNRKLYYGRAVRLVFDYSGNN